MASPVGSYVIGLPIADRRATMDFYRAAFDFTPTGPLADDGVPEPLQYWLGEGVMLMFIPTGGFGWVLGDREIAPAGVSECLLSMSVATEADVRDVLERVRNAGGEVIGEPARQEWGYVGTGADLDGHVWQIIAEREAGV